MQPCVLQKEGALVVQGAVTFETVAIIQKKITEFLHNNSLSTVQVDLKEVTQVNSAALGLLVELKKQAIAHKKAVHFLNPPERLLSLAQVCGVSIWLELK